ncbi:MAG: SGNH/GDSL hydrolase family protein [Phycisphaeraceae bacterium]
MFRNKTHPHRFSALLLGVALTLALPCSASAEGRGDHQLDADLPRVLIIGDSISQGYHQTVVNQLKGKAIVTRIPQNGEWTGTGVEKLDDWLGDTPWVTIHFNFGLWDMYGWPYHEEDRSPKAYRKRLNKIVKRLKQTGATLIWATTTPACPEPEVTMLRRWQTQVVIAPELEKRYLDAAARVMKKHKVRVNDLHALIKPQLEKYAVAPDNVHFTAEGSERLGKQVAAEILRTLETAAHAPADPDPADSRGE